MLQGWQHHFILQLISSHPLISWFPSLQVMIHRAILGSVERMFAILLEHYAGKWPLWLSPRQVTVCPVSEKHSVYAQKVTSCAAQRHAAHMQDMRRR